MKHVLSLPTNSVFAHILLVDAMSCGNRDGNGNFFLTEWGTNYENHPHLQHHELSNLQELSLIFAAVEVCDQGWLPM